MKVKLRLDTLTDVQKFVEAIQNINEKIEVTDNAGYCVNAKSILGMLYSLEWKEIWCQCNTDIYQTISNFVI